MKTLLALASLVLLATVAVLWNQGSGTQIDSTLTPVEIAPAESEHASEHDAGAQLAQLEQGEAHAPSERVAALIESPEPLLTAAPITGSDSLHAVSGTLVVIRLDGTEDHQATGLANFSLTWNGKFVGPTIAVVLGEWTLMLESPALEAPQESSLLRFKRFLVDGERYLVLTPEFSLPTEEPIELRAQAMQPVSVRVVSAASGADLNNVTVVETDELPHPDNVDSGRGPATVVAESSASPITLPHPTGTWKMQRELWFCAPGYAWKFAVLSIKPEDERIVALEVGGGLEIWLEGDAPPGGSQLAIFAGGKTQPTLELKANPKGAQLVEGLGVGEYTLRLHQGNWWDDPLVLAEETVTVQAGVNQDVHLQVTGVQAPPRLDAKFFVHMPDGWDGDDRVSLSMQAMGDVARWVDDWKRVRCWPKSNSQGSTLYAGTASKTLAGQYMVVVSPSDHRITIELTEGTLNEFSIQVPEPCAVEVRVIDDGTGLPIPMKSLAWHAQIPEGVSGYALQTEKFKKGIAKFQAPAGELLLSIGQGDKYTRVPDQSWILTPGLNEITVHLQLACGVRIVIQGGGTLPAPSGPPGFSLSAIDHSGRPHVMSTDWCRVTEPGSYRVHFSPMEGFEKIPDRVVEIPAGEMLELEVKLTPKGQ